MAFDIIDSAHFEREFEKLIKRNREVIVYMDQARAILVIDPHNFSRQHKIKKLTDVPSDEGQWRLRIGRYRLRYDIRGKIVQLHSIRPRPEAYR